MKSGVLGPGGLPSTPISFGATSFSVAEFESRDELGRAEFNCSRGFATRRPVFLGRDPRAVLSG